jgi:transposase
MDKKDLNKWIMYHQIHHMQRQGCSILKISEELVLDRRTVKKYLSMSEEEYFNFIHRQKERYKILSPYEYFVKEKLEEFPETKSAQIHDWLKEHFKDFPNVASRTVYNFVIWIRQKYNIPKQYHTREFFPVEECDYGQQAQADFGEYNMRTNTGRRKKVHFFSMSLSRSRYKFVYFTDMPFDTEKAILGNEKSFEYFHGIPQEIVYDQDKLFLHDENHGDIILNQRFKQYVKQRGFSLHFCRKADPQSKGKIENVIKYIKQNFLYNRLFSDIDTLNNQALGWLTRTANALPHNKTKKVPYNEWLIEKRHLKPFTPVKIPEPPLPAYNVRKDNTIAYQGCFYTLPHGTYKGPGSKILLMEKNNELFIFDLKNKPICRHGKSNEKGKTISNTDHKRDKSQSIDQLIEQVCGLFDGQQEDAKKYLLEIRKIKNRYARDQILLIKKSVENIVPEIKAQALMFCIENNIYSATDFQSINKASIEPQTSNIIDYEKIISNKN